MFINNRKQVIDYIIYAVVMWVFENHVCVKIKQGWEMFWPSTQNNVESKNKFI